MVTTPQLLYIHLIKRPTSFIGALVALIITSPILLGTMIILLFVNKDGIKGIFFFQNRPGKHEKIFKVIKFKTMTDAKDDNGVLLPDAKRLTKVGKLLRETSIDELPQLINILKGDMAFIGPRPLRVHYLSLYSPEQHRRHSVSPGISGLAQVNGRNNISWTKRFELDVYYVDHIGLGMDVKIFFTTIRKVFMQANINNDNTSTMYPFDGTN